jgi:hypothetical protein
MARPPATLPTSSKVLKPADLLAQLGPHEFVALVAGFGAAPTERAGELARH